MIYFLKEGFGSIPLFLSSCKPTYSTQKKTPYSRKSVYPWLDTVTFSRGSAKTQ